MSEPRLPHDLRLGKYFLDDIVRAFGFSQWFLCNITRKSQLSAPMIAEILAHLHLAGIAVPMNILTAGEIFYEQPVLIVREHLRAPLARSEAMKMIDRVCEQADELNRAAQPYSVRGIYLFGSCLRDAEWPRDIDLGVEIHRKGKLLREPSYYPFAPPSEFDDVARPLALRKPKLIKLHHIAEVRAIGAPHRLIWCAERGRVLDAPSLTSPAISANVRDYEEEKTRLAERQKIFDVIVERIASIAKWPHSRYRDVGAPRLSRDQYQELQGNELVMSLAHLRCLPEGALREQIQKQLAGAKSSVTSKEWLDAEKVVDAFVAASVREDPWRIRHDGRLVKRGCRKLSALPLTKS